MNNSPSMEKKKPAKRGDTAQANDGSLVLVNKDNQAYKVSETVVFIWTMCDGSRSLEEVTQSVAKDAGVDPSSIRDKILDLTQSLERAGLLEFV